MFQTNDLSVKDIVTFYKIWHKINNSANVNFYTITLRPTYMVNGIVKMCVIRSLPVR